MTQDPDASEVFIVVTRMGNTLELSCASDSDERLKVADLKQYKESGWITRRETAGGFAGTNARYAEKFPCKRWEE